MFACPSGCDLGLSIADGCCICCQDNNEADLPADLSRLSRTLSFDPAVSRAI